MATGATASCEPVCIVIDMLASLNFVGCCLAMDFCKLRLRKLDVVSQERPFTCTGTHLLEAVRLWKVAILQGAGRSGRGRRGSCPVANARPVAARLKRPDVHDARSPLQPRH